MDDLLVPPACFTATDIRDNYLLPQFEIHLMPDMAVIRPPKGLLLWSGDAGETAEHLSRGRWVTPEHEYGTTINLRSMQNVNGVARDLYVLCNGHRTGREIYVQLLKKHGEPDG